MNFLLPADQQATKAVEPRMRSFDHPPSRPITGNWLARRSLNATYGNVRRVAPAREQVAHIGIIVSFVQAKVLPPPALMFRPWDDEAAQGRSNKLFVMRVRAADDHSQRDAVAVGEQRAFGAQLATIRRVFPGFFPHPAAPWSSLRRDFANATGCAAAGRIRTSRVATTGETLRDAPTLESNDAANCPSRTPPAPLSTGNLCAGRKTLHPQPAATARVDDHPSGFAGALAAEVPAIAIVHPGVEIVL